MGKKEYYTFADLVLKLRGNYRNIRKILKEMEKCISIQSPYKTKFELGFLMRNPLLSPDDKPKLVLSVSKKDPTFSDKVRKLMINLECGHNNPLSPLIDNAKFYYDLEGDRVTFDLDNQFNFEHAFCPTIVLTDESYIYFRKLCDLLKQNKLYSLFDTSVELNPYQILSMSGSGLSLFDDNRKNNWVQVGYNPKTDKVSVESRPRCASFKVEELFMTQIPRFKLPQEYASLLDTLPGSVHEVYSSEITSQKESLTLSVENKGLNLIKKIGPKK